MQLQLSARPPVRCVLHSAKGASRNPSHVGSRSSFVSQDRAFRHRCSAHQDRWRASQLSCRTAGVSSVFANSVLRDGCCAKLTKFVTISGSAGADRPVEASIGGGGKGFSNDGAGGGDDGHSGGIAVAMSALVRTGGRLTRAQCRFWRRCRRS